MFRKNAGQQFPIFSALSCDPIGLALKFVEGAQVGFRRRDHDVGIGTNTIDHTTTVL